MVGGRRTGRAAAIFGALGALALAACAAPSRPPQLLASADLRYPDAARAAGIEGLVRVRYDVTAQGSVVNAKVESSAPPGVFDDAALAVVRSWRFRPQMEGGASIAALGRISEVRFELGDTDRYAREPSAGEREGATPRK